MTLDKIPILIDPSFEEEFHEAVKDTVDWRLMIDLPDEPNILISAGEHDNFLLPLIEEKNPRLIFWSYPNNKYRPGATKTNKINFLHTNLSSPPFKKQSFNLILFRENIPDPHCIRPLVDLLHPGGSLIFKFHNPFWKIKFSSLSFRIEEVKRLINVFITSKHYQKKVFGLIPNPRNPTFIFPLRKRVMSFAIKRYYGHKLNPILVDFLTKPGISSMTIRFLPAYLFIIQR